jgi:ABC-type oligopeptide transport system substrate-binding subunit
VQNVKNQLRSNLGIELELVGLESKMVRARYNDKNYVMGITQWTGDYGDPSTFTDMYLATSQNNDTTWANPAFDDLIAQANRQTEEGPRMRFLEKAERILITEAPIVPMYHVVNMDWSKTYVTNYFHPRMTTVWKGMKVDRAARDNGKTGASSVPRAAGE